jgi:uncharacterized protein
MRITKYLIVICITLNLFACASTKEKESVKYYSLGLNPEYINQDIANQVDTNKSRVIVGPIQLAAFLRQKNMIMQIGDHEIYSANYHRWAEPLDEAIGKLLIQELNNRSEAYQFEKKMGYWNQNARYSLRLDFENFHASDNAETIVSGRYWFYGKEQTLKLDRLFNYADSLTRDGYLHSVEKLKQAIVTLADEIIESLNKLE